MDFIQRILPADCYGSNTAKHAILKPEGILCHFMSAINANVIGLDNSDPYDVDVCIEILKYYKFSAHVLIDRKGRRYQCVPFDRQAWHAGESLLNGREKCNEWCLSIEFFSTGKPNINGEPAYTEEQIVSGIELIKFWCGQYPIKEPNVSGHQFVRDAAIRAGIKTRKGEVPVKKPDPGPHFPWPRILEAVPS